MLAAQWTEVARSIARVAVKAVEAGKAHASGRKDPLGLLREARADLDQAINQLENTEVRGLAALG